MGDHIEDMVEALVATAENLPLEKRELFIASLAPEHRGRVVELLRRRHPADELLSNPADSDLPTLATEQSHFETSPERRTGHGTVFDVPAPDPSADRLSEPATPQQQGTDKQTEPAFPSTTDHPPAQPGGQESPADRQGTDVNVDPNANVDPDATEGPGTTGYYSHTLEIAQGVNPPGQATQSGDSIISEDSTFIMPRSMVDPYVTLDSGSGIRSSDDDQATIVSGGTSSVPNDGPTDGTGTAARVHLLRPHARGSIGEVYVAYDSQLSREVALKRIRPRHAGKQKLVSRFVREAVVTAQLQHPGIVPIYNFGSHNDSSHYTMPLVSGETLAESIKNAYEKLGPRANANEWSLALRPLLNRLIAVCHAIDFAHSRNVLHRDLKPANIMLGQHGQTLVLDWGCARILGERDTEIPSTASGSVESQDVAPQKAGSQDARGRDAEVADEEQTDSTADSQASEIHVPVEMAPTVAGTVMGTIEFMSPEQAAGDNEGLTPASDIFGLGATMFNLLTNDTGVGMVHDVEESLAKVRSGEFRNCRDLNPRIPPPLAAICSRAMHPVPEKRYATAGELAEDIDRFLADQPVSVYREPVFFRLKRLIKQNQTVVAGLMGMLLVGFISLFVVTLILDRHRARLAENNSDLETLNSQLENSNEREKQLNQIADQRAIVIQQNLYANEMLLASEASREPAGVGRVRELIDNWRDDRFASTRGWEWQHLASASQQEQHAVQLPSMVDRILFAERAADSKNRSGESERTLIRAFSRAQSLLASVDLATGKLRLRIRLPGGVSAIDYSPNEHLLAVGFHDGRVIVQATDALPKDQRFDDIELKQMDSNVTEVLWNHQGTMLAVSGQQGEVRIWDWETRELMFSGSDALNQMGNRHFAWRHDGTKLAWATGSEIRSVDPATGETSVLLTDDWTAHPCWSHDDLMLAYVGPENSIRVFQASGDELEFSGHQLYVESLSWHPSKHYLLSSSGDGSVKIWNTDTRSFVRQLRGHVGHVLSSAWSPDGSQIVSGGYAEDKLRIWDMKDLGNEAFDRELSDHPATSWHPNSRTIAVAEDKDILLQTQDGKTEWLRADAVGEEKTKHSIFALSYNQAGDAIACVSGSGRIWIVNANNGKTVRVLDEGGGGEHFPSPAAKGVDWSADDRLLAGVDHAGALGVWDVATGKRVANAPKSKGTVIAVAWSPGASQLAFAGTDNVFHVWDAKSGSILNSITQYGWKTTLAWSADGNRLAVNDRRSLNIWDLSTNELVQQCKGPSSMVLDADWSESAERIAAITEDGQVCLWNTNGWKFCGKYELHQSAPYSVDWSPDGITLSSTSRHGHIELQSIDQSGASAVDLKR